MNSNSSLAGNFQEFSSKVGGNGSLFSPEIPTSCRGFDEASTIRVQIKVTKVRKVQSEAKSRIGKCPRKCPPD